MKTRLKDGRIELVPLIDVIFVLMVFFMLAAIKPPPEETDATVSVMVDDVGAGSVALADAVVQLHDEPAFDQPGIVLCTVPEGQEAEALVLFDQEVQRFKARLTALSQRGQGFASLFAPGAAAYTNISLLRGGLSPQAAKLLENRAVVLRTGTGASVQEVLQVIHRIQGARVSDLVVSPKALDGFPADVEFAGVKNIKRSTEGR